MSPIRRVLTLLVAVIVTQPYQAIAAPKTDILIFENGDKLTGELKSLKRGKLSFNTDATGTISIEWDKVAQLISTQHIQVETSSGARYFGELVEPPKDDRLVVVTGEGPQILDPTRVIIMEPIEGSGFSALDVDVSLGYNFAKANGVKQVNAGLNASYRTRQRILSLAASTIISDSDSEDASERKNFAIQWTRLFSDRWTTSGNLALDQNDELGLNLRTAIGFGGGRFLIQSNTMLLNLEAGLQVSNENLVAEEEDTQSLEATFTAGFDWFRFDDPELDWSTVLQIIPSITESGRVRAEFDTSLKWEIIGDLNWGLTLYSSYDSQPQSDAAKATIDYGINTSLVYEF